MEILPQSAIQGLLSSSNGIMTNPSNQQNSQLGPPGSVQAIQLANGGHFLAPDPNEPGKWQILSASSVTNHAASLNASLSNTSQPSIQGQYANSQISETSSQNISNNSLETTVMPPRKMKRLACTCPNCRDGDNGRNGDKKKQHICHYPDCNKVYGKTSHLRAHLRWHSGKSQIIISITKYNSFVICPS